MSILYFNGYSDDVIELEAHHNGKIIKEEWSLGFGDETYLNILDENGAGLVAHFSFRYGPSWSVGVSLIDEGNPIPPFWLVEINNSPETDYSPQLRIQTTQGTEEQSGKLTIVDVDQDQNEHIGEFILEGAVTD